MKTNQQMTVKFKNFGTLHVWHKDGIGRVSDILAIGNQYRATVGANPIESLQSYLRKPSTWRTIIAIHNKMVEENIINLEKLDIKETMESLPKIERKKANCSANSLKKESKKANRVAHGLGKHGIEIDYAKILKSKQFKHIIKSQRGGKVENRGYWADLYLMIDIAMMMNEEFKVELIHIFVTKQLLLNRDQGGDAFKKLNILIDTLPDRIAKAKKRNISIVQNNKMVYRNIATMINKKINGAFDEGWNDEKKEAFEQERRAEILKQLCSFINMGFVQSYDSLKETIGKL